jgi:hypothetical protein
VFATQLTQSCSGVTASTGQQFIEDQTQAVEISASVNLNVLIARNLAPLFRRHVIRRAQHLASHRERSVRRVFNSRDFSHFRDAEIQQLHNGRTIVFGADHDVLGFQIAMYHAH